MTDKREAIKKMLPKDLKSYSKNGAAYSNRLGGEFLSRKTNKEI